MIFLIRNDLKCYDVEFLSNNTFTHINYGNNQCRWFDHCIGRMSDGIKLASVHVLEEMIGSDHLPLLCKFAVLSDNYSQNNFPYDKCSVNDLFVDWNNLSSDQLMEISAIAFSLQGSFRNNNHVCLNSMCQNDDCLQNIDKMYSKVVDSAKLSSLNYVKKRIKKDKYKVIPGWNRTVRFFYNKSRDDYFVWLGHGKPNEGPYFNNMSNSKKCFKQKLKECKRNKDHEISISIQNKFKNKSAKEFWREVRNKKILAVLLVTLMVKMI